MSDITKALAALGIHKPNVTQRVPDHSNHPALPPELHARPFEWDRPMVGLYAHGQYRVLWRNENGDIQYCRFATDEELKFIMAYEKIESMLQPELMRETIFKAMAESGFVRTSSCCDYSLQKMCNGDEYKGNLEGFLRNLFRKLGLRK